MKVLSSAVIVLDALETVIFGAVVVSLWMVIFGAVMVSVPDYGFLKTFFVDHK